jgi:hypothetical protein
MKFRLVVTKWKNPFARRMFKSPQISPSIRMNLSSAQKAVAENSIERLFKSTKKPVNWFSCPKENSSIQKQRELHPNNK